MVVIITIVYTTSQVNYYLETPGFKTALQGFSLKLVLLYLDISVSEL